MKKQILNLWITAIISTLIFIPAALADDCCPHERAAKIDHKSEVNEYVMEYQFIDIKEKMEKMKAMGHSMEGMNATHHLMVYIRNDKGESVEAGKVGFLIVEPDGKNQKVMAMGMSGGYGSDVDLSKPGEYTVKSKALMGEKKLIDSFKYTIE